MTLIASDLVLFSPSQTVEAWARGSPSLETRSQLEALVTFLDVKNPVCLLCGGPLKPIGLMGVIGPPDVVRKRLRGLLSHAVTATKTSATVEYLTRWVSPLSAGPTQSEQRNERSPHSRH